MVISSNFWPKNIFDEIWPKVDKKYFVIWPQNIKILCYLTKKICRKSKSVEFTKRLLIGTKKFNNISSVEFIKNVLFILFIEIDFLKWFWLEGNVASIKNRKCKESNKFTGSIRKKLYILCVHWEDIIIVSVYLLNNKNAWENNETNWMVLIERSITKWFK